MVNIRGGGPRDGGDDFVGRGVDIVDGAAIGAGAERTVDVVHASQDCRSRRERERVSMASEQREEEEEDLGAWTS